MKIILAIILFATVTFGGVIATKEYRTFTATAYTLRGKTASGQRTRQGIIAADPRVLPLGTRVQIEGMGTFVVADTGGAVKGNKVDIWMPSNTQAKKFGRRKVRLRIV